MSFCNITISHSSTPHDILGAQIKTVKDDTHVTAPPATPCRPSFCWTYMSWEPVVTLWINSRVTFGAFVVVWTFSPCCAHIFCVNGTETDQKFLLNAHVKRFVNLVLFFFKAGDFRLIQSGIKYQLFLLPAQWPHTGPSTSLSLTPHTVT